MATPRRSAVRTPKALETLYGVRWYDAAHLAIHGRAWRDGFESPYHRLPVHAKAVVRETIWRLSTRSAGVTVHFKTDSPSIDLRWIHKEQGGYDHMPGTGTCGFDLYIRTGEGWKLAGVGRHVRQGWNGASLVANLQPGTHQFMVHLPLYSQVEHLHIGVAPGATIRPDPFHPGRKPVVMYGTSITHGGCACRPGMAYPAILTRKLDWPCVNLGFDGNGMAEPEVIGLLAEIDAQLLVFDAIANMGVELVRQRLVTSLQRLREAHPRMPILVLERPMGRTDPVFGPRMADPEVNQACREEFAKAASRLANVHIYSGKDLLGHDGEATVDCGHPTDLGFLRMAENLTPVIRRFLPGG